MISALRVLVVDGQPGAREGVRQMVEGSGGMVVAEAGTSRETLKLLAEHRPHLAIVDLGEKAPGGAEMTARIKRSDPSTRVLILSGSDTADDVTEALKAGADGYLLKDAIEAELALALRAMSAGDKYLSPRISRHVVEALRGSEATQAKEPPLSARQREVLQMMAGGRTMKEIAFTLGVSVKTVETHRARIMERLDIRDLPGLVVYAIQQGLIDLDARRK